MSRSYRFPESWYAKFPAHLEASLAAALGYPPEDGLRFHAYTWRAEPKSPVRRSALAAELRRRGWPAARAHAAAAIAGRWIEACDADDRRFARRSARRREHTLIASGRAEELGWKREEVRHGWW